ncbi:MAG: glycosyltransferase family 2 protein [Synechococcaceae cyanobacterium RL_1_2]|nr:glycosyltransferase family 2 protein [Synechococcaceae cyanobacterium RL_1_2]
MTLKTPVVFVIFNRPDNTQKVFERIRQAQPSKLLVIADGARANKPEEEELCQTTRAIIDTVDWDCEVLKNYSDINLGIKERISSGFNWVFELEEEAIILEDDCLPDFTFFRFCEELLEQYRDDTRVMEILGSNVLTTWKPELQSYHFSYFGGCWGWATWRRAWQHYDVDMQAWQDPEVKQRLRDIIGNEQQYQNRAQVFDATYTGKILTWDYQWLFTRMINSGLSITPSRNLISNLGFNSNSTNTSLDVNGVGNLPTYPMAFPMKGPQAVVVDRDFDNTRYAKTWDNGFKNRLKRSLKRRLMALK